jgi:Flp pilus assembly pilin Flp
MVEIRLPLTITVFTHPMADPMMSAKGVLFSLIGTCGTKQNEGAATMLNRIKQTWADEAGLTTVEYALLLALLVVAAITVWTTFGATIQAKVATSGNTINGIS